MLIISDQTIRHWFLLSVDKIISEDGVGILGLL